jgi:hypothetical protein
MVQSDQKISSNYAPGKEEARMALEIERKYLDAHKAELIGRYGGKILVICGEQVTGAYDTMEEALQAAMSTHGLKNILIRRPTEDQIEFCAPALTLGIINANHAQSNDGAGKNS